MSVYPKSPFIINQKDWQTSLIPRWHETAEKMRSIGVSFLILAALLGGSTAIFSIFFSGYPISQPILTIFISVSGGCGTVFAVGFGIFLIKKPYWKDPQYREEKQAIIIKCLKKEGYEKAKAKYSGIWDKFNLFDKQDLEHIVYKRQSSYRQLQTEHKHSIPALIDDEILNKKDLRESLIEEAQDLGFKEFIEKYGWQPFEDKILNGETPMSMRIDDKTVQKSIREIFLDEISLVNDFQSLKNLYPKETFWNLFLYIIPESCDRIRELLGNDFHEFGFFYMIRTHGWNLFSYGAIDFENGFVAEAFWSYVSKMTINVLLEEDWFNGLMEYAPFRSDNKNQLKEMRAELKLLFEEKNEVKKNIKALSKKIEESQKAHEMNQKRKKREKKEKKGIKVVLGDPEGVISGDFFEIAGDPYAERIKELELELADLHQRKEEVKKDLNSFQKKWQNFKKLFNAEGFSHNPGLNI